MISFTLTRFVGIIVILIFSHLVFAQSDTPLTAEQILKLYEGLRVADVSDGMDYVGLHDQGLMNPEIEPLWKDIQEFKHWFVGIALTVRYVPTNRPFPSDLRDEAYERWRDQWYTIYSGEPFIDSIKTGSVVVIDNQGDGDTGSTGSNNSLLWTKMGAVGIVSARGVRDTDEINKQEIPVYMNIAKRGRGIRPGRNELESVNQAVVIGGVLIHPGDVIVAHADGVIVVLRNVPLQVAQGSRKTLNIDKAARRQLYQDLGIPLDFTVEDEN